MNSNGNSFYILLGSGKGDKMNSIGNSFYILSEVSRRIMNIAMTLIDRFGFQYEVIIIENIELRDWGLG